MRSTNFRNKKPHLLKQLASKNAHPRPPNISHHRKKEVNQCRTFPAKRREDNGTIQTLSILKLDAQNREKPNFKETAANHTHTHTIWKITVPTNKLCNASMHGRLYIITLQYVNLAQ